MADKFRSTFPVGVVFSSGELPTSTKFNGLATQAKQGLSIVEYALGDLWNQAGDNLLSSDQDNAILIPNIARFLGRSKLLGPRLPSLPNIELYTHKFEGNGFKREFRLPFRPASGSTYTWTGTSCPTGSPKGSKYLVRQTGDWFIDTYTGNIVTFDYCRDDWQLVYKPIVDGDLFTNAGFNIIPDPDTVSAYSFAGLKVRYANGSDDSEGYEISLPPRGPLETRSEDWLGRPQDNVHSPAHSANLQDVTSSTRLFWQSSAVDACTTSSTNAEHYRYTLPKVITDNWSQNAILPAGMIYLYDPYGTGTIIEGVTFYAENAAIPKKWFLIARGANLTTWLSSSQGRTAYPTASLISTSEAAAYYPSTGLRLLVIGTSITDLLDSVITKVLNHNHSNPLNCLDEAEATGLCSQSINHKDLLGLALRNPAEFPAPTLDFPSLDGDDHIQYLERHGYNAGRDKHCNMLLGHLVLSSTDSTSDYQNLSSNSYRIHFGQYGDTSNIASQIYWDTSLQGLHFIGTSSVAQALWRFSQSNSNYPLDVICRSDYVGLWSSGSRLDLCSAGSVSMTAITNIGVTAIGNISLHATDIMSLETHSNLAISSYGGTWNCSGGSLAWDVADTITLHGHNRVTVTTGGSGGVPFLDLTRSSKEAYLCGAPINIMTPAALASEAITIYAKGTSNTGQVNLYSTGTISLVAEGSSGPAYQVLSYGGIALESANYAINLTAATNCIVTAAGDISITNSSTGTTTLGGNTCTSVVIGGNAVTNLDIFANGSSGHIDMASSAATTVACSAFQIDASLNGIAINSNYSGADIVLTSDRDIILGDSNTRYITVNASKIGSYFNIALNGGYFKASGGSHEWSGGSMGVSGGSHSFTGGSFSLGASTCTISACPKLTATRDDNFAYHCAYKIGTGFTESVSRGGVTLVYDGTGGALVVLMFKPNNITLGTLKDAYVHMATDITGSANDKVRAGISVVGIKRDLSTPSSVDYSWVYIPHNGYTGYAYNTSSEASIIIDYNSYIVITIEVLATSPSSKVEVAPAVNCRWNHALVSSIVYP